MYVLISLNHTLYNHGYKILFQLSYPESLHHEPVHFQNPLCPEVVTIKYEHLSPVSKAQLKSKVYKSKKMVSHFGVREKYCLHYRNLQFYLQKGKLLCPKTQSILFHCSIKPCWVIYFLLFPLFVHFRNETWKSP